MSNVPFRMLHLTIRQKGPIDYEALQGALSPVDDWFRYSPTSYLLWTELGLQDIYRHLRESTALQDHSFLLLRVEPHERQGWMPKDLWEWMEAHAPRRKRMSALARVYGKD